MNTIFQKRTGVIAEYRALVQEPTDLRKATGLLLPEH
jgi:hypothetical protein